MINKHFKSQFFFFAKIVGVETEKVSKEKAVADIEEEKVSQIEVEVTKKKDDCAADLAKAEPALIAAQEALNTLNKVSVLGFLSTYASTTFFTKISLDVKKHKKKSVSMRTSFEKFFIRTFSACNFKTTIIAYHSLLNKLL